MHFEKYDLVRIVSTDGEERLVQEVIDVDVITGVAYSIIFNVDENGHVMMEEQRKYILDKVWRLDGNENYITIYDREKQHKLAEETIKRLKSGECRPADIKYEIHERVVRERDELKEIIVELNKKMYEMGKYEGK